MFWITLGRFKPAYGANNGAKEFNSQVTRVLRSRCPRYRNSRACTQPVYVMFAQGSLSISRIELRLEIVAKTTFNRRYQRDLGNKRGKNICTLRAKIIRLNVLCYLGHGDYVSVT
ncbi:hypothetical protein P5V15_007694 [Pogonomyrmex californicus]